MFDLTGRTALVTGATGGIGGAIAEALHKQGAKVAISGTRREVLDTLAARMGERVHVLPCNLSDAAEVEALVPSAEQAMGVTLPEEVKAGALARTHSTSLGRPTDIAGMVALLASDDGVWINGQILSVDGGRTMR